MAPFNYFQMLPEGCTLEILSRTTPVDAIRSSTLSKSFNLAVESDTIWECFLPSDYQELIGRSDFFPVFNTKREMYFSLCDSPILLDGGKLSFSLDKHSGKKCFMVSARELIISWGGTPQYWKWKTHSNSRFNKVAFLKKVQWLDIRGRIGTEILSPKTEYSAYLVYSLIGGCFGLEAAKAIVRYVDYESDGETERQADTVTLQTLLLGNVSGRPPKHRADGWWEVKLGEFNSKKGVDGCVEARLIEIERLHIKRGLIVEGIEFRPIN